MGHKNNIIKMNCPKYITRILRELLSVATFLALVGIVLSIRQFNADRVKSTNQENQEFNSRMSALGTELAVNLLVCDQILAQATVTNGLQFPETRFMIEVLPAVLISGEIHDYQLRHLLASLHHQICVADRQQEHTLLLHFLDGLYMQDTKGRQNTQLMLKTQITRDRNTAGEIRALILASFSSWMHFWKSNERHDDAAIAQWQSSQPGIMSAIQQH